MGFILFFAMKKKGDAAKVKNNKWRSNFSLSSTTTTPVPTPLPLPTTVVDHKSNTIPKVVEQEEEQSERTFSDAELTAQGDQAFNVVDGFHKEDSSQLKTGAGNVQLHANGKVLGAAAAVSREEWAAIKIQQAFRSHLVRVESVVVGCFFPSGMPLGEFPQEEEHGLNLVTLSHQFSLSICVLRASLRYPLEHLFCGHDLSCTHQTICFVSMISHIPIFLLLTPGYERSGKTSSIGSWTHGEKTSCHNTTSYGSSCASASSCASTPGTHVRGWASCTAAADETTPPASFST
jgi:hypothetical protein